MRDDEKKLCSLCGSGAAGGRYCQMCLDDLLRAERPKRRDYLGELEKIHASSPVGEIPDGGLLAIALFRVEGAIRDAGVYSAIGGGVGALLAGLGKAPPDSPASDGDVKRKGH